MGGHFFKRTYSEIIWGGADFSLIKGLDPLGYFREKVYSMLILFKGTSKYIYVLAMYFAEADISMYKLST